MQKASVDFCRKVTKFIPCTHEMRTMHLIREQVGCTVQCACKKREKKKEKEWAHAA